MFYPVRYLHLPEDGLNGPELVTTIYFKKLLCCKDLEFYSFNKFVFGYDMTLVLFFKFKDLYIIVFF